MPTLRTNFILATSTLMLVATILLRHEAVALVCLSVVFWVWLEWIWFQRMLQDAGTEWTGISRTIDGQSDDRVTIVTDKEFEICLCGVLPKGTKGYRIAIRDSIPDSIELLKGSSTLVVDSSGRGEVKIRCLARTPVGGQFLFPGIQVEISDFCGLFRKERFAKLEQTVNVIPFLIRPQTTVSVLKHNNLQQHLGHHRHRSAGISSELHGIRDYQIGDPPRTIAWKPTARLGKPMTREFENEVPIRATILVDLAGYMYEGRPGPSPADRAITSCASIAKLLLADRDPVAATLLTDRGMRRLKHGSGERQMTRLFHHLLSCSNPNPPVDHLSTNELVQVVFENGARRFPGLFDEEINSGPCRWAVKFWKAADHLRSRRTLAVVLEQLFDLSYGFSTRLQFDDCAMRRMCLCYVERYSLYSHATSIPLTRGRYDAKRYRQMTHELCQQLLNSRQRSRDNELFVLIAPEPFNHDDIQRVLDSVKSTIATHHRVIFVSPEVNGNQSHIQDPTAARILAKSWQIDRCHRQSDLRDGLVALGASFARIDDPTLMQMVSMEIGLLQSGSKRGSRIRAR